MPDILTFLQRTDGTIVSAGLATYQDGRVVAPPSTSPPTTSPEPISRVSLSYLYTEANGQVIPTLFPTEWSASEVTGPAKLAQRFVLHLLTQKGSIPYRSGQGCRFYGQLQNGPMATEADVFAAFAAALRDVRTNLQAEEESTDPDDERFQSARIETLTISQGVVSITVRIVNLAGTVIGTTIPLPVNV